MPVDRAWLDQVRQKNRRAFGMPSGGADSLSMSGLGARQLRASSQDLVSALDLERQVRTEQIHQGRFEQRDPNKPTEGSVESIAQALQLPPGSVPAPQPVSQPVVWAGVLTALGVVGVLAYAVYKRTD